MSAGNCPECGNLVARSAYSCPRCGNTQFVTKKIYDIYEKTCPNCNGYGTVFELQKDFDEYMRRCNKFKDKGLPEHVYIGNGSGALEFASTKPKVKCSICSGTGRVESHRVARLIDCR